LGKFVETHFVPALAVVRSETDASETVKYRRQHQNASCYEIITTCPANLRFNRRIARSQAGLARLAGQSNRLCSSYTSSARWFAINVPVKIGAGAGAKVVTIPSQPAMPICGKNRGCILFQSETTQNRSHEILIRLQ
jgi:hypothetical protein